MKLKACVVQAIKATPFKDSRWQRDKVQSMLGSTKEFIERLVWGERKPKRTKNM